MVVRFRFALVVLTAIAGPLSAPASAQDASGQEQPAATTPAPARSGGVTVMKGNPPPKAPPVESAPADPGPLQPGDAVMMGSGGRHMWMVDRANGEVTDCQSRETSTPGERTINCATRPLPVPSR